MQQADLARSWRALEYRYGVLPSRLMDDDGGPMLGFHTPSSGLAPAVIRLALLANPAAPFEVMKVPPREPDHIPTNALAKQHHRNCRDKYLEVEHQ